MEFDVRFEHHNGQPLAVVRRRVGRQELSKVVPECCGTVWNVIRAQQVPGTGRHVALYWDDQINLEVGVELAAPYAGHGEVVGSSTPAGPVATTTHYGPYGLLGNAHNAIQLLCQKTRRKLAGTSWEVYGHWNDEWNNDPTKIRTDIYYLLAADGSELD